MSRDSRGQLQLSQICTHRFELIKVIIIIKIFCRETCQRIMAVESEQIFFLSRVLTLCILEIRIESLVYDQNFYWGGGGDRGGGWRGGGLTVKGVVVMVGSSRNTSKNILK